MAAHFVHLFTHIPYLQFEFQARRIFQTRILYAQKYVVTPPAL